MIIRLFGLSSNYVRTLRKIHFAKMLANKVQIEPRQMQ